MGYIQKTVILQNGQLMWVTKVNAPMFGNHRSRVKRLKETSEAVKKTNENHAVEYVRAKIIENFSAGDPHIILTYTDENLPDSEERAKKNWKNFVARLKRRLEKNFPGKELKYITITEKGVKSRRWHHHIILPDWVPMKVLQELWPHGYISSKAHLDKNMDVKALAKYLVDKTKGGQKEDDRKKHSYRFSFSKNCINPVVTYEHINSKRWRKEPKPPKGYELIKDTLVNSVTESGYLYQRYEIRKISDKNKSCRKNI